MMAALRALFVGVATLATLLALTPKAWAQG